MIERDEHGNQSMVCNNEDDLPDLPDLPTHSHHYINATSMLFRIIVLFVSICLYEDSILCCGASRPHITVARVYPNASAIHLTPSHKNINSSCISSHNSSSNVSPIESHLQSSASTEGLASDNLNWMDQKDVQVVRYLDSGRFSNVFEGLLWKDDQHPPLPVVIKVLKPTFMGKVRREMKMLELLLGVPNVVQLHGVTKNQGCQTVSLILEHLGREAQWLSHRAVPLTAFEIQLYMYKLIQALDAFHSRGVMHRDIKPRNVLYNRRTKELRVIDLGLSDLYFPGKSHNPSVASRHYKSPELLFDYPYYDYGIDVWSAGCMLATLVFDLDPFFNGADSTHQIETIAGVVGSKEILAWAQRYNIKLTHEKNAAVGGFKRKRWTHFRTPENQHLCSDEALDLVGKMLEVDHQQRITAGECLQHPFFDSVRDIVS